jgi:hypothetical protein
MIDFAPCLVCEPLHTSSESDSIHTVGEQKHLVFKLTQLSLWCFVKLTEWVIAS